MKYIGLRFKSRAAMLHVSLAHEASFVGLRDLFYPGKLQEEFKKSLEEKRNSSRRF